jgi:hypothetical protein
VSVLRLLADCGNSGVRLGVMHEGGAWAAGQAEVAPAGDGSGRSAAAATAVDARGAVDAPDAAGELDAGRLGNALVAIAGPFFAAAAELVLLPVGRARARAVATWWAGAGAGRPLRVIRAADAPDDGLGGETLALPALGQYAGCGADRVVAGLVAALQEARDVVVVDAGTATTISAWRFRADVRGFARVGFAGGLIAPGGQACALGLHHAAPALPLVCFPYGDNTASQHSTYGAIAAALMIGHPALVAACLQKLCAETAIATVVFTGGGAPLLIAAGIAPRLAYRPTLVLEGMAAVVAGEAP